jgi:hypothetical protein
MVVPRATSAWSCGLSLRILQAFIGDFHTRDMWTKRRCSGTTRRSEDKEAAGRMPQRPRRNDLTAYPGLLSSLSDILQTEQG